MDEYNAVMSTINGTESAVLNLGECSLSKELDNVSDCFYYIIYHTIKLLIVQ